MSEPARKITKAFPTSAAFSAVSGLLIGSFDDLKGVVGHMIGRPANVFNMVDVELMARMRADILEQHPWFDVEITSHNWRAVLAEMTTKHGETVNLTGPGEAP